MYSTDSCSCCQQRDLLKLLQHTVRPDASQDRPPRRPNLHLVLILYYPPPDLTWKSLRWQVNISRSNGGGVVHTVCMSRVRYSSTVSIYFVEWWDPDGIQIGFTFGEDLLYHASSKHVTVQTLYAGRLDDRSRTRDPFLHLMFSSGPSFLHLMISSGPSPFFILCLWTEFFDHIMGLSVASRHEDEMTWPAIPKLRNGDTLYEAKPRCLKMRALVEVDYPE
jgi:hypothetical protein